MNSQPVVALDLVRDDVQSAYDYFEDHYPGAGERFLRRYFAVTEHIAANAGSFRVVFDEYQRALVPKSNLAIYSYQQPHRSIIVPVIDARRDPRVIRGMVRGRHEAT